MGKGWFQIGDVQEGHVPLARQLAGLQNWLAPTAARPCFSLLDLGCAEGLVANWVVQNGHCDFAVGIEGDLDKIKTAIKYAPGVHVRHGNFNDNTISEILTKHGIKSKFDTVLALAIAHKLKDPLTFLEEAASLANHKLIVRLPFGHELCEKMKYEDMSLLVSFSGYPGFDDFDDSKAWTGLYLRQK